MEEKKDDKQPEKSVEEPDKHKRKPLGKDKKKDEISYFLFFFDVIIELEIITLVILFHELHPVIIVRCIIVGVIPIALHVGIFVYKYKHKKPTILLNAIWIAIWPAILWVIEFKLSNVL